MVAMNTKENVAIKNLRKICHYIHLVQSSDANSLNNHGKRSDALKKSVKHFLVRHWNDLGDETLKVPVSEFLAALEECNT